MQTTQNVDTQNGEFEEAIKEDHRTNGVQVIARAVSIMRTLKGHPEGLTLSHIAKQVKLPRSTVHRIISALEAERFIAPPSPDGRIRLGLGLVSFASSIDLDLRRELRPYLEQLYLEVNETIDLAFLDEDHLLFVDQIAAPHRLRAVSGTGLTFPLYCTANGKALLAKLPREQVERLIPEQLEPLTANTITTRAQLLKELDCIQESQVAFDREEHTLGICAVGAALKDPKGRLAAISIPVPSIRFGGNEQKLAAALVDTIKRINERFATI